jgi:hypothetical protein
MKVKALFLGSDNTHPGDRRDPDDVLYYLLTPERGRPRVVSLYKAEERWESAERNQPRGHWLNIASFPDLDGCLRLSACILFECAAVLEVQ